MPVHCVDIFLGLQVGNIGVAIGRQCFRLFHDLFGEFPCCFYISVMSGARMEVESQSLTTVRTRVNIDEFGARSTGIRAPIQEKDRTVMLATVNVE